MMQRLFNYFIAIALLALPLAALAADDFVGAEACKTCHPKIYDAWKEGPHAGARYKLDAENRDDSRCIACHAPARSDGYDNVQCEHCHGGGKYYSKDYIMKDVELAKALGMRIKDYKGCKRCHSLAQPTVKDFDAKKDWQKLPHAKTK